MHMAKITYSDNRDEDNDDNNGGNDTGPFDFEPDGSVD
jgi:hypothetical protein